MFNRYGNGIIPFTEDVQETETLMRFSLKKKGELIKITCSRPLLRITT